MKVQMICLVWGKKYTQTMLELCLASLLTEGNLFNWPYRNSTTLMLYTTSEDWGFIQSHPVIEQLKQYIQVDKYLIDLKQDGHHARHFNLIAFHQMALKNAADNQQSVIFLAPDVIFGTNSLTALAETIAEGSQLVLTAGFRVNWETIYPELLAKRSSEQLDLSEQDCTELFVKHMHQSVRSQFIGHSCFNAWLSHVYYWSSPEQIVLRAFHLHPIFIRHVQSLESLNSTIDGSYMQQYFSDLEHVRVFNNERLFVFSLTYAEDQLEKNIQMKASYSDYQIHLDRFRRIFSLPIHHYFFSRPITLKLDNPSSHYIEFEGELIQGLELFWEIEKYYKENRFEELVELFEANQALIFQELIENPFKVCFYFVKQAYQAIGNRGAAEKLESRLGIELGV